MHRLHTGEKKGLAGTPRWVIDMAVQWCTGGLDFTLDACALESNKVCPRYISPEQDFIKTNYDFLNEVIWLNPPYTKTRDSRGYAMPDYMRRAYEITRKVECMVCALIESNMSGTKYFERYVGADEFMRKSRGIEIFFVPKRINFILPGRPRGTSHNTKASMIVVYNPPDRKRFKKRCCKK